MATVTSKMWSTQQAEVWGDKDPDVFRRVVDRIARQELEVVREVERMVSIGVSAHEITKYVTNSILRGVDVVEYGPPGIRPEEE